MAGKKQGKPVATPSVNTRSRAAVGFNALDGLDDNFPALLGGKSEKQTVVSMAGPGSSNSAMEMLVPGDPMLSSGMQGNANKPAAVSGSSTERYISGNKQATDALIKTPGQRGIEHKEQTVVQTDPRFANKDGKSPPKEPVIAKPMAVTPDNTQPTKKPTLAVTTDALTRAATTEPWSALFKDNRDPRHGIKLKYVPPKGDTLDFGDRILPSMVEMWGFCLVGHFTGNFPGLKAVHELRATWGVKCLVRSHNKGWVIFKFTNEEDRTKVLHNGPYNVFGKLLMLKELSDDFSFEDEEFLKVPIWVKFPKLPMKLWNDEAMSEVASMVGVPITTDKITQERTNNEYARVLIEVDVSKPPPLSFPIRLPSKKVFKQCVLYETFPSYCFHCKEFGHHPFICKKLAKQVDGATAAQETAAAQPTGCCPDPTGYKGQKSSQESANAATVNRVDQGTDVTNLTAQEPSKAAEKEPEVIVEDIDRIVMEEKDLKFNDVVIKCEVINGKTLKLVVKPFRFVHASVIRVDTSLRLTDDLDKKGLTFTAKCLEGMPGVAKKKGEVCFDSKFTTPFRAFFGV
ncbi:unnamed protein product [Cuscuta epithymum]|uniref:DUF4283 domain-containing protein n=1 Tax=Cuscuta epithymum TaxID=186058 RepID=A0AAV0E372_9ASTE|nr:unnamed protein product [Cuscuta epithymum]